MKNQTSCNDRQKGSAILLSLGILSLVLLLAMSFAFTANTRKNIAQARGAATRARMFADEAVELTVSDMQYMFAKSQKSGADVSKLSPAEGLNRINITDGSDDTASFNQTILLFNRFKAASGSASATNPYLQNYALSSDPQRTGSDAPDDYEKYYLGKAFGLAKTSSTAPSSYTSTNLDSDWYNYNDFNQNLSYLPQLRFLSSSLKGDLAFAPPVVMSYSLKDDDNHTETLHKVTGRYAYILLDESNKLDINSIISLSGSIPTAIDHPSATADAAGNRVIGGGKYADRLAPFIEINSASGSDVAIKFSDTVSVTTEPYPETSTIRLGLLPEELLADPKYRSELPDSLTSDVKIPWQSYSHLCQASDDTYCKLTPSSATDYADLFTYTFFGMEDIEAYWDDTNGKEVARFDLSGMSWGNSSDALYTNIDTDNAWQYGTTQEMWHDLVWRVCGLAQGAAVDATPQDTLDFWKDSKKEQCNYPVDETTNDITNYSGHLDWLHQMVDNDGNSVAVQVASNLKDFSDKDDFATTDFQLPSASPATAWSGYSLPDPLAEPKYCGNERVAYFNEFAIKSGFSRAMNGTTMNYDYTVDLYVATEMLNIYCIPGMANCGLTNPGSGTDCKVPVGDVTVKLYGKLHIVRYEGELDAGTGIRNWTEKEVKNYPLGDKDTAGYKDYLTFSSREDGWSPVAGTESISTSELPAKHLGFNSFYIKKQMKSDELANYANIPAADIQRIRENNVDSDIFVFLFTIDKIVAYSYEPGKKESDSSLTAEFLYDVACPPSGSFTNLCDAMKEDGKTQDNTHDDFSALPTIVSFQAKDCRINHKTGGTDPAANAFWTVNAMGNETSNDIHTLNKTNTGVAAANTSLNSTIDLDDVSFKENGQAGQTSYSTAFIRNAPMKSLWELGAIHRGYPNQTINLKEYTKLARADKAYYSIAVNNNGGDAAILDQVKIGPLMFVKGKINANQRNPKIWEKLLSENMDYCWYDRTVCADMSTAASMDTTNTTANWNLTSTDLAALKDGTAWAELDDPTSYSRAAVTNVISHILSTKGISNDRDMEAYIGRTAGLLTTRCEAYSLLLYAESLDDITDSLDSDTKTLLDNNTDGFRDNFAKTQRNFQVVQAQIPGESTLDSRYCTVTGKQKVLLHLLRDAWTNEIKVISKQYLTEE